MELSCILGSATLFMCLGFSLYFVSFLFHLCGLFWIPTNKKISYCWSYLPIIWYFKSRVYLWLRVLFMGQVGLRPLNLWSIYITLNMFIDNDLSFTWLERNHIVGYKEIKICGRSFYKGSIIIQWVYEYHSHWIRIWTNMNRNMKYK